MIDLHTHILPGIDDGSDNLQTSINMVKHAVSQGVTDIFFTPHYRDLFNPSVEEINQAYDNLKNELNVQGITVNTYLGQEIFVDKEIKTLLKENKVLTLNGTKYVLIEFDLNHRNDIASMVYEVKIAGYIPIVAHLERYYYSTMDIAREIKGYGALIQVNAGSIVGRHKSDYKKMVKGLFKEGLVDFVASDVHSSRENMLLESYNYVSKKFGKEIANAVYNENAKKIIKG